MKTKRPDGISPLNFHWVKTERNRGGKILLRKAIKADLFTWQEGAWSCSGFLAEGPTALQPPQRSSPRGLPRLLLPQCLLSQDERGGP